MERFRAFGLSVIALAMKDLARESSLEGDQEKAAYRSAKRFLIDQEGLVYWCDMAGLEMDVVTKRAKQVNNPPPRKKRRALIGWAKA